MTTSPQPKSFKDILYSNIYPLPYSDYFLILAEKNGYQFWPEVISLILPHFKEKSIDVVVVTDSPNNFGCPMIKDASWSQKIYLCQNSVGHIGCDKTSLEFSNKGIDFFSVKDSQFNDLPQSVFNKKSPSDVASFICGKQFQEIKYLGINFGQNFVEFVPTSKAPEVKEQLVLRIDKGGDLSNAVGKTYNSIIFNKFDAKLEDVLPNCGKIYVIVDDINLSDILGYIDNRWSFICKDQDKIAQKRCEFIDYKVFPINEKRRGMLENADLSDCICSSKRKIYKDGEFYNSYAHARKGLTFAPTFDIIDSDDFWESQDFLRILKK